MTAISASGFNAREYVFMGFLPREKKPLREKLQALRKTGVPVAVAYESPHRVRDLVAEFGALYPACPVLAACDLTKKFELLLRGLPAEIVAALDANPKADKGEYTVVFDFSSLPAEEEPPRRRGARRSGCWPRCSMARLWTKPPRGAGACRATRCTARNSACGKCSKIWARQIEAA